MIIFIQIVIYKKYIKILLKYFTNINYNVINYLLSNSDLDRSRAEP